MNSIINSAFRNISIALAALLLVAVLFAVAPKAQAADLFGDYGYGDYYASDFGGSDFGYGDYYASDFGGSDFGYGDYYASDYGYGDYYPDSGFSDYGSGFGGMGGFGGGGFTGGSTLGGGGNRQSQNQSQAQSQSSYNNNVNNNVITIGGQIAQQTQYCPQGMTGTYPNCSWPQQYCPSGYTGTYPNCVPPVQYCPSGYTGTYPNCVPPVVHYCPSGYSGVYPNCVATRPIAYNNTPYVTLAAVPYTGLELGPVGTALYWGFLVLWCLFAAYLIVVKKVHNKIAAWFTGGATQNSAVQKSSDLPSSGALRATPAGQTFVRQNSAPLLTGIDPFIQAQINRAK